MQIPHLSHSNVFNIDLSDQERGSLLAIEKRAHRIEKKEMKSGLSWPEFI
jgi:hypothetical protein